MTLSGTAILTKIRKFPQFGGSESHIYNPSQSTVKVEKNSPRSRILVKPTAQEHQHAPEFAAAVASAVPRRASSQPMTSQRKPTTTADDHYS